MSQIFVTKKNESLLFVSCDEGTAQELSDYFAFYAVGYQYQPLYKSGIWDGKIRLYDRRFSTLPHGLVHYIQKFANDRQYDLVIDDPVLLTTNFSIAEAAEFANSLKLPVPPYAHQIESFAKCIRNRRAMIISPTSSGKSLLIYLVVRFLQQSHHKGVIVVPTTSLVEQFYSDLQSYGWDVEKYVHRLYEGQKKITKHYLTITTYQSLALHTPEYLAQFDFIIGDEAHQYKAKGLSELVTKLISADVRIGTTGTLDGTTTNKLVLEGLFGPIYQATTTKQLMNAGIISQLKIKCLILKYPEEFCQAHRKDDYQEEYIAVMTHPARLKFIRNLAKSVKGNTLILFQLVEKHGKLLYQDIKERAPDHQVFFVHKDVTAIEREQIRKIAETNDNIIIVASYGTFSTGINIRNLHNIIFAGPSKGRIRNLQSIGRGLRKADGKEYATLFDIVDDLRIGKHENFLLRHFAERVTIYNSEKLTFKPYHVEIT